jgi:outer membrane protein TolC
MVLMLWLGLDHYANGQATIKANLLEIASSALAKNPTIVRSEYAVRNAESNLQIQRSVFDLNSFSELLVQTNQYVLPGVDPRTALVENSLLKSNTLNLSAGVRKRLRTGQFTDVSMNYGFSNNNYPMNAYNQPINTYLGNNAGTLNLSLTQPLLRGRGRSIATALERSYTLYVDNAKSNNEFANSYELWQVATAYWGYTAAYKNLDIYKQSENRLRNVLSVTEELIKGDKKPAGDLVQIRADLASQERLTLMAEQDLYAAKVYLGKVVGFSTEESLLLDIPQNDFPSIVYGPLKLGIELARHCQNILFRRISR